MRKITVKALVCVIICSVLASCSDIFRTKPGKNFSSEKDKTFYYANFFGVNALNVYYLWNEEISDALNNWNMLSDPIRMVSLARYKDASGKDIDRWTQMYDNYKEISDMMGGVSKTYGYDFALYLADEEGSRIVAVVTYVTAGGPAEAAGMKRGDVIVAVNGVELTISNYVDVVNNDMRGSDFCTLYCSDGHYVNLKSVSMYEDPVLLYKVFDCGGKKVGYLHYTSFTLRSYARLLEAAAYLKSEGISELILDLRYNGGGYVTTEYALASLLAPQKDVDAGSVFETTVYNSILTRELGVSEDCLKTEFSAEDEAGKVSYSTKGCNLGINKLYAILGSGSASASESLLVGLMPYMDVEIIGQQSHGKYCSGILYSAADWYNDYKDQLPADTWKAGIESTKDWGIYMMIGRYADKFGNTPCMPDGFIPDVPVNDRPDDGRQLGDPEEVMLATALREAGYPMPASGGVTRSSLCGAGPQALGFDIRTAPKNFGMLVRDREVL